ncbi:hypothetical protein [Acidiferrobacter thiooxydans]|uniref:hypothetical protein n=1 Tax=Acidiferrobacter thiooxydans TaxID=163359 RepID=UPI0011C037F6|nr:hypothetical protein [Acidiferrobacter thiooxydans]
MTNPADNPPKDREILSRGWGPSHLSRLNRTYPGKDEPFVLDFVNAPNEILESFQPYYRAAQLEDVTDPNIVHE